MSKYIKLSTLQYPLHEGDIRNEYPNIKENQTGDTFPVPDSYAKVVEVDMPEFDLSLQIAYEKPPIQINGVWTMQWEVHTFTQEELNTKAQEKIEADAFIEKIKKKAEEQQLPKQI